MGNQVGGVGPAGPSPEEIAALQQQQYQQQQDYLVSSELQFMITSLQTMANQLQDRITEAKETSKEEAAAGLPVMGAAPSVGPASATGIDPTTDLADISACPASLTTFSQAVLTTPAETDDKAKLLLSSTTLDNTVQQLVLLSNALKATLSSNVSPSALEASLQKVLPGAVSLMNQLATTVQNMPTVSPSLKDVHDSLQAAGQNLLLALSPPPTTTADLASFSTKLASQVQNPTSALMQTHLTHLQTANKVGGSLGVVMPKGHISGLPDTDAKKGLQAGAPKGTNPPSVPGDNPWAAVWQWMFGSNGLMAKVGSKMGELSALLRNQSKAMQDFSKMLGFFASLAKDGISYNFNPSQNHADKTGWANFQKAIYMMNKHWPSLDKGLGYLKSLIGDIKALTKVLPSIASTVNKMMGNFYRMCNGFYAMRYMGTYQVLHNVREHTPKGIGYLHTPGGKYVYYNKTVGKYIEIHDAKEHTPGGGYMHTAGGGYQLYTKKITNPIRVTVTKTKGGGLITYVEMKKNPHVPQWVYNAANHTWGRASPSLAKVMTHNGKPLPTGARMKWSSFANYQHGAISNFNHAMQSFRLEVKDAGPNIQSIQTGTQSQIKLYLTYYQQIMQTGPSLVQTLNSLAMAVSANLRGGQ